MRKATMAILAAALGMPTAALQASPSKSVSVTLAPSVQGPQSGRLLVFAKRVEPRAKPDDAIDASQFEPASIAIAARGVWSWTAGRIAQVDAGVDAFPAAFATLPPGRYRFQAVLDRSGDYGFDGRGAGDVVSAVVETALPGTMPMLTLATEVLAPSVEQRLLAFPEGERAAMRHRLAQVRSVDFISPVLTRFHGRPTSIRGWIALPLRRKTG